MKAVLVGFAAYLACAAYALVHARSHRWPKGRRLRRHTRCGIEVVVINAPQTSPGYASEVADACARAVSSAVETWRVFRPGDRPQTAFSVIGVNFVPGGSQFGFSIEGARRLVGDSAPVIVLSRLACDRVVGYGEPIMQGTIRILLSKTGGGKIRQHEAWARIWLTARYEFSGRAGSHHA